MTQRNIVLVVPDIRSIHNVGSLLRTADGLGVERVYLCGYTPHPSFKGDTRLPHVGKRQTNQIAKTALGAEKIDFWTYVPNVEEVISDLKLADYIVLALEQTKDSIPLNELRPPDNIAIVLGSEVTGLPKEILKLCSGSLEIPMLGNKESFNVVEAATMAMYHCRFN